MHLFKHLSLAARLRLAGAGMDIDRPDLARERRKKRIRYGVAGGIAVALAGVGISQLKPALPSVERGNAWIDQVRRGTLVRQVRAGTADQRALRRQAGARRRGRERAVTTDSAAVMRAMRGSIATSDGSLPALAGLIIGLIAAAALARFLSGFLFGLSPFDPLTWIGVSLAFSLIVLTACWLPARRAAAIDPSASLRVE